MDKWKRDREENKNNEKGRIIKRRSEGRGVTDRERSKLCTLELR